jgi:hypothetical protein
MIEMASSVSIPVKLTIFSGGCAISGTVVPDETFFERLGLPGFAASSREERVENERLLSAVYESLRHADSSMEEKFQMLERVSTLEPQFIMMVDVTILGTGPTPITAPVWRGRLSQISGWIPGALDEVS